MKSLDLHHDGHGLNESIDLRADDADESGASHSYRGRIGETVVLDVQFQRGPRNVPGSIAGATEAALLAILIDRIEGFESGPFRCYENVEMLRHLRGALRCTSERAHERARRGVLGRNEP